MKSTMGRSISGYNLLRMKSDLVFIRIGSPKSDINLKLNRGSELLGKGLNLHAHTAICNLLVKKLMAGIINSAQNGVTLRKIDQC